MLDSVKRTPWSAFGALAICSDREWPREKMLYKHRTKP